MGPAASAPLPIRPMRRTRRVDFPIVMPAGTAGSRDLERGGRLDSRVGYRSYDSRREGFDWRITNRSGSAQNASRKPASESAPP